ncbi:pilus assembly protein PilM [Candidatus Babeliales bacterium]|nr:pilus assembly protein PilM [Candidatus Babeliales bacterium]
MIKNIFLPEKIGNFRIYSQKILGIYVLEKSVTCAQVHVKRNKNIIEKLIEEKIEEGTPETYIERTAQTIQKILSKVDKYDLIRVCIPASLIVFKELEVPFKDTSKIRMILDYEIESMLPFPIEEAVVDFIITKQSGKNGPTKILAAAIRNSDLENILKIYHEAKIEPNHISIDLFAIYSLYQQIPEYKNIKNVSVIIDLGSNTTHIAFLQDGALRLTRIIPRGIQNIAQKISNDVNIHIEDIKKNILDNGLQTKKDKVYEKHFISFFHDIQFTLNSFLLKLNISKGINKILFTGKYSYLKDLSKFCNNLFQISCEVFSCEKLFENQYFKNKVKTIQFANWSPYLFALGTALPSSEQYYFDLRKKIFLYPYQKLIKKQLITSLIIIFIMFTTIVTGGYLQTKKLSNKIKKIEEKEIKKLKKVFPKEFRFRKKITLPWLIKEVENLIKERLEIWAPFEIKPLDTNMLVILQELTNIIDKRQFDVMVETVSIVEKKEIPKIEVVGFFRSKTGSDHYTYFAELEKKFNESKILKPWDEKDGIEPSLVEDKGIRFTAILKLVEEET